MIIGIIGNKRSGKDTIADILVREYGFSKYAFADPIKEICETIFFWDYERMTGPLKETIDPQWGISPRQAMQRIGTELFQIQLGKFLPLFDEVNGRLIWARRFKYWYENINDNQNVVVSDVRFKHEVSLLNKLDSTLIKVNRPSIQTITDSHSSESAVNELPYNYLLENNKGLGDLAIKVHNLMNIYNE